MMDDAVEDAVRTNMTRHPVLINIFTAEDINRRNNGPLVAAWNLDQVPEDYLMAYDALRAVKGQNNKSYVDSAFADFRRKAKYREY